MIRDWRDCSPTATNLNVDVKVGHFVRAVSYDHAKTLKIRTDQLLHRRVVAVDKQFRKTISCCRMHVIVCTHQDPLKLERKQRQETECQELREKVLTC